MKRSIKTNEMIVAENNFNVGDYPACKLFLPITETSGLVLSDLVLAQNITFAPLIDETFTFADNGVAIAGTVAMTSNKSETLPDLGTTNDLIHVVVADFDSDNTFVSFGSQTSAPTIKLTRKSGAGTSILRDTTPTTNTLTSTAIDGNTEAAACYTVRATPRLFLIETDGAAVS